MGSVTHVWGTQLGLMVRPTESLPPLEETVIEGSQVFPKCIFIVEKLNHVGKCLSQDSSVFVLGRNYRIQWIQHLCGPQRAGQVSSSHLVGGSAD